MQQMSTSYNCWTVSPLLAATPGVAAVLTRAQPSSSTSSSISSGSLSSPGSSNSPSRCLQCRNLAASRSSSSSSSLYLACLLGSHKQPTCSSAGRRLRRSSSSSSRSPSQSSPVSSCKDSGSSSSRASRVMPTQEQQLAGLQHFSQPGMLGAHPRAPLLMAAATATAAYKAGRRCSRFSLATSSSSSSRF